MDNKNVIIMIILAILLVCIILFSINKLNNTFIEVREDTSSNFFVNYTNMENKCLNSSTNDTSIENNSSNYLTNYINILTHE